MQLGTTLQRLALLASVAHALAACGQRAEQAATPAPQAVTTAETPAAATPEPAKPAPKPKTCEACRDRQCRDHEGSGVDVVQGCFERVVETFGAKPDPNFNE